MEIEEALGRVKADLADPPEAWTQSEDPALDDKPCAIVRQDDLRTLVSEVERLEADLAAIGKMYVLTPARLGAAKTKLAATQSRLARAKKLLRETDAALKPFGDAVFNDNGDVTYDYSCVKDDHYWKAYHVRRRNAAFLNAPPEQA